MLRAYREKISFFFGAVMLIVCSAALAVPAVNFQVVGRNGVDSWNVAHPGGGFSLDLNYSGTGMSSGDKVQYRWIRYWGAKAGPNWQDMNGSGNSGQITPISSPWSIMNGGYYGLQFRVVNSSGNRIDALFNTDDSIGVSASNRDELGFAVMNAYDKSIYPWVNSHFGLVQLDKDDPYVAPVYTKNLTATRFRNGDLEGDSWVGVSGSAFKSDLNNRYDRGQRELPILTGYNGLKQDYWTMDNSRPHTDWTTGSGTLPTGRSNNQNLSDLGSLMNQFSFADYNNSLTNDSRRLLGWELGVEEQFKKTTGGAKIIDQRYYYGNLSAKADKVRGSINQEYPSGFRPKLVYQIVNPHNNPDSANNLIRRLAGANPDAADVLAKIDVLAPHMYDWDDFADPDSWMLPRLQTIANILQDVGHEAIEMWMTETGMPMRDSMDAQGNLLELWVNGIVTNNPSNRIEGAPDRNAAVSRLIKTHILALVDDVHGLNVNKVIWYNYKDRGGNLIDPESHFGMRDHWGFVKPSYVAFAFMTKLLRNLRYDGSNAGDGTADVRWIRFERSPNAGLGETGAGNQEEVIVAWRRFGNNADRVDFSDLGVFDGGISANHFQGKFAADGFPRSPVDSTGVTVGYHPVYLYFTKNPVTTLVSVP